MGLAPKRGLGVSAGFDAEPPNKEPAPGLAKFVEVPKPVWEAPPPKIGGFDCAPLFFASGDVCIDSPKAVDCPNGEGLFEADWPKTFVDGALLEALFCPKILPVVAGAAVAGCPEDPLVVLLPNKPPVVLFCCDPVPKSPPEGKGCWAGAELPAGGTLNMFPLKPEKLPPSDDWVVEPAVILAKGLLVVDPDPPNDEEKLNEDELLPPEPKENGVDPFWVGWLGFELAPGKLCD